MIISHRHHFIFVAIPKTGTHSVRRALRAQLGPDDHEQVRLFVESQLPWPELAALKHGHISLAQVRPFLGEEKLGSYLKFAFVRNPFARFVSYCAFTTSKQGSFEKDPQGVMRYFLFQNRPTNHLIFRPQHCFVTGANVELLADELGRVEEMQESFDRICARIGIASTPLDQINTSRHGGYRDYYDQQMIDAVAQIYARDLELFGYDF